MAAQEYFELRGDDNNSWLYSDAPHCRRCTRVTDSSWIQPSFKLVRRRADFSSTYDGGQVVSDAFLEASQQIPGATFTALRSAPGFHVIEVEPIVHLDTSRNDTQFGELCVECGQPTYVISPGPLHLLPGQTVPHGFSRADLRFGDTADFGPDGPNRLGAILFLDAESAQILLDANLREVRVNRVGV